jgi:hypothetical protein
MNITMRKVVKEKDIFQTADFVAVKNNNETYFIVHNRHGISNVVLTNELFKDELLKSSEPIVLNSDLFKDGYFRKK